jgi:hypothetical protein
MHIETHSKQAAHRSARFGEEDEIRFIVTPFEHIIDAS